MKPLDVNASAILSYLDSQIQYLEVKLSDLKQRRADLIELVEKVANTPHTINVEDGEHKHRPQRLTLKRSDGQQQGTVGYRIRAALKRVGVEFTSKDILEEANRDGGQEIPRNTFAPEFSKLIRENVLVVVSPQSGNKPGVYRVNTEEGLGAQDSKGASGFGF